MDLAIRREDIADAVILWLQGSLTARESSQLSRVLQDLEDAQRRRIVFDCTDLQGVDSVGLGLIIATHKRCLEQGGALTIRGAPEALARVLRLTSLDRVLRVEPPIAEEEVVAESPGGEHLLWELFRFSQHLFKGLGDGLVGLDAEGRVLFADAGLEERLGRAEEDLIGRLLNDFLDHGPGNDPAWSSPEAASRGEGQHRVKLARGDGTTRETILTWVAVRRQRRLQGYLVGIRDHGELEETRRALRQIQHQLSLFVANASDAFFLFDAGGRLTLANPAAQALTGLSEDQCRKKGLVGLATAGSGDHWRRVWERVGGGEEVRNEEIALTRADGRETWCTASASPIKDESGAIVGMFFVLRDVNDQRRLRRQLNELELKEAMQRVAGGLARDFECLIDNESRQVTELNKLLAGNARGRHLIAEMRQQYAYLRDFTARLRALGHVERNVGEKANLSELADRVLMELRPRFSDRIRVAVRWEDRSTTVAVATDALDQIVRQVCLNALESMDEQGELSIWSEIVDLPAGEPHRPGGRFVRLNVQDSGRGMSPETCRRAFDPFFSTKSTSADNRDAVGMGLPVAYGLLRQYNGWIDLASEPGRYTRVALYLPIEPAEIKLEPATTPEDAAPRLTRLLVVDDEALVLNFAAAYLERAGFCVNKAGHPQEALSVLRDHGDAIDMAIIDLSLPSMSGRDLMRQMRQLQPRLRFLISSGMGEADLAEAAQEDGVCGALQKPYRGDQLVKAVQLGMKGAEADAKDSTGARVKNLRQGDE
jgi:anti-anti-sigma factor